MGSNSLQDYMHTASQGVLDACTRCGACVEICPVVPHAGAAEVEPALLVGGVLDVLRDGGPLQGHAAAWAGQCDGCGLCIPACPEGVNPRTMLMLAQSASKVAHTDTPQLFRKMSRAIRLMAAMQLAPADMARLLQPPRPDKKPVIFYTGCNAIRTPHLLFNAMYVLDALDVDYAVMGGPSSCCGIIHGKWEGETDTAGRVIGNTLKRFGDFEPERVLSWCPSCQMHLGESLEGFGERDFGFDHVTSFLVEEADRLAEAMTTPVPMRVVLHAHDGMADLGANVERLLRMVPQLEIAEVAWESGYTCGGSGADRSPTLKAERRAETLRIVRESGADALISLYHGCHAQLAGMGEKEGITVINFTDLLVRALGGSPREDLLYGWRMAGEWRALAEHSGPTLRANGMDLDPNWLEDVLPDVLAQKEFKGGLETFAKGG